MHGRTTVTLHNLPGFYNPQQHESCFLRLSSISWLAQLHHKGCFLSQHEEPQYLHSLNTPKGTDKQPRQVVSWPINCSGAAPASHLSDVAKSWVNIPTPMSLPPPHPPAQPGRAGLPQPSTHNQHQPTAWSHALGHHLPRQRPLRLLLSCCKSHASCNVTEDHYKAESEAPRRVWLSAFPSGALNTGPGSGGSAGAQTLLCPQQQRGTPHPRDALHPPVPLPVFSESS